MKTHIQWLRLQKCAICGRRARVSRRYLDELSEASGISTTSIAARAVWHLCDDCYAAVGRELARAGLRTPARVQVALGVVAAERGRPARYHIWDERFWEQLSDRGQDLLLIWIFAVAFVVHAVAFMLVAAYVAIAH